MPANPLCGIPRAVQPGMSGADRRRLAGLLLLSLRDRHEDLTHLTFALLRCGGRRDSGNAMPPKANRRPLRVPSSRHSDYIARMVSINRTDDVLGGSNTIVEHLLEGWRAHSLYPYLRDHVAEPVRARGVRQGGSKQVARC